MNHSKRTQGIRGFRTTLICVALSTQGCGLVSSIKRDPTAIMQDDKATLPVVVQRAEAARVTATQVDRLLTATPVGDADVWTEKAQLTPQTIDTFEQTFAEHPYYETSPFRIVPALVWASGLSRITRNPNRGEAVASVDAAASALTASSPAAATDKPSLLAAISPSLGAGYAELQHAVEQLTALKARKSSEELAQDEPGISDTVKKQHEAGAQALSKQIDAADIALDQAKQAYFATSRVAASQAPAAVRERFVVTVVNLRQAVREANNANAAAAAQYARLLPDVVRNPLKFKDVLIDVVKASVSDYVFERTGKRVRLSGFKPAVTFDNGKVAVVLNGLSVEDAGQLDPVQLLAETVTRTERFAVRAATLVVTTCESGESLDLEADLLDGILEGFQTAGSKPGEPARIAAQTSQEIQARAARMAANDTGFALSPF
jgi:hypothetical protein